MKFMMTEKWFDLEFERKLETEFLNVKTYLFLEISIKTKPKKGETPKGNLWCRKRKQSNSLN